MLANMSPEFQIAAQFKLKNLCLRYMKLNAAKNPEVTLTPLQSGVLDLTYIFAFLDNEEGIWDDPN